MSEAIKAFARKHRLRVRLDTCGEVVIPGKPRKEPRAEDRNHIYEHGQGMFGIYLQFQTRRKWNFTKKRLLAKGFTLKQDGDTEGTLLFNPETLAKAAIREVGARIRRPLSPEQLARLHKIGIPGRKKPLQG